jgi:hypothetical protein
VAASRFSIARAQAAQDIPEIGKSMRSGLAALSPALSPALMVEVYLNDAPEAEKVAR